MKHLLNFFRLNVKAIVYKDLFLSLLSGICHHTSLEEVVISSI